MLVYLAIVGTVPAVQSIFKSSSCEVRCSVGPLAPKIYASFLQTAAPILYITAMAVAKNRNHSVLSGDGEKKLGLMRFGLQSDQEVISRTAAHHFPQAIGKR